MSEVYFFCRREGAKFRLGDERISAEIFDLPAVSGLKSSRRNVQFMLAFRAGNAVVFDEHLSSSNRSNIPQPLR